MADEPVTLREAAQLAGISTHAMRMRYRRSVKAGPSRAVPLTLPLT
jgi:hypothetical protein